MKVIYKYYLKKQHCLIVNNVVFINPKQRNFMECITRK